MWPILLDMSKLECKKTLRTLEFEAYAMIVSAFRAQGDLTQKKIEILKELQFIFKISFDRHKAELRRAMNDEKLYTIAKLLSHGDCVTSEWIKQSKRIIPLLPTLQCNSSTSYKYRILADQILSKSEPIFNLYPEQKQNTEFNTNSITNANANADLNKNREKNKKKLSLNNNKKLDKEKDDNNIIINNENEPDDSKPEDFEKNILYLKTGYAVDSKFVQVENTQPSEYIKRLESINECDEANNSKSFLNYLIKKYKEQKQQELEKEKSENLIKTQKELNGKINNNKNSMKSKAQETIQSSSISIAELNTIPNKQEIEKASLFINCNQTQIQPVISNTNLNQAQTAITPSCQTQNLKIHANQMIKLNSQTLNNSTTNQINPIISSTFVKLNNNQPTLTSKLIQKPAQKLIILPTGSSAPTVTSTVTNTNNLKILTVQPTCLNQKILLNVQTLKSSSGVKQLNGFNNNNSVGNELNDILSLKRKQSNEQINSNNNVNNNSNNKNLVYLKLDSLEEDSVTKNGYHKQTDDIIRSNNGNKRIKLIDFNQNSNSNSNITE